MHPRFSQAAGMTHDGMGAAVEVDKGAELMGIDLRLVLYDGTSTSRASSAKPRPRKAIAIRSLIDRCLFEEVKAVEEGASHPQTQLHETA